MPTDGIYLRRLVGHRRQAVADEEAKQAEHDAEPGHIDGGIGVQRRDPRQRLAEWPQQREAEPDPDQQQQRAEHAIAREQDGRAGEEQQHRGDAEEEIEPDQGGAICLGPVGPVGETERAQQRGRSRDQELDPVGHGFPYQSRNEVGSHRGVSRRTPAAASREYTSDGPCG